MMIFGNHLWLALLFTVYFNCLSESRLSTRLLNSNTDGNSSISQYQQQDFGTDSNVFINGFGTIIGSITGLDGISLLVDVTQMGMGVVAALSKIFQKVMLERGDNQQLLAMFEIITVRLEQIHRGNKGVESSLRSLVHGSRHMVRWEIALDTLESYIKPINNLYHKFFYYQKYKTKVENHTLIDFAENAVSHQANSMQDLLANLHSMVSPSDPPTVAAFNLYENAEYDVDNRVTTQMSTNLKMLMATDDEYYANGNINLSHITFRPSIFQMLENAINNNYETCYYNQSPQQLIFGLYTIIAVTLARAYTMINFSYNILKIHNKGNFTIERKLSEELYIHYSEGLIRNSIRILESSTNSFLRCDPKSHIENETFVMITELLQGYVENEVDLNVRGTCKRECSNYQAAKVEGCYSPKTQLCGNARICKGSVYGCQYIDFKSTVCLSSLPYRRYEWIKYDEEIVLGVENNCQNSVKVNSWWRFPYRCTYCFCFCDDETSLSSDRFISLRSAVSNIAEGRVVTGLKFVKKERVLHIQVQEGEVMPQGQINPDTIRWITTNPIDVKRSNYLEGVDYVTLNHHRRNIDLDHLQAPENQVITGIRFISQGAHISFEIRVTPINFTTGKINHKLSIWINNENSPNKVDSPRVELILTEPDDPRRMQAESRVDSRPNMFVRMQPTSVYLDVAQLTVPFFDAQPVSPFPATWMEGVELYHRGKDGYGGFIAFKTFSYNLTRHF